ncbi:MAG: RagB/SusD family nutrient uptake outer membrane protein [Bacteroidales bacterium]|jgi:hypothetical protein|nr:RagB/SusD family nutrient uptake outer membrane protein [Bacteroidales bacterium]
MKNIHIYFLSLMLLGFSSCTKFLDRQNPMTLNPDQAYNTVEKCGAGIGGLMANFTSSSFTGRNIPVFGDLFTDNATTVYAPSGHLYDIENWNVSTSQGDMASIWAGCYATAAQATDLIIAINKLANSEKDGLDAKISEDNIKQLQVYRGAALSIKAYCEWLLIQYYCLPYYNPEGTDNGNTNGIILIGDSKIGITEKVHTSSLKASYDHIVAEIDTAISLYTRNNKQTVSYSGIASWEFVPSLAMAYILKGRIMLDLKRNNEAIEAADLAIVNATNKRIVSDTTELLEMYQKEATPTPEDIWTIYFDKSDNNSANSINNFFRDYRTTLSNDLVNLFNGKLSKDIRKVLYKGPAAALAKTDSVKSFCLKYPNVSDVNNVPLMRLPEAYYIKAEAQTKLGNTSGAKETMFEIISKRNSDVTDIPSMETIYGTGNSKEDVLNFIITDKRREFAGEGLRWFDLRRNSMRLTRTGYSSASAPSSDDPNSPTTVTLSYRKVFINYPIYKICLPIPDIETNTRQWTGNQNEVWATENGSPTFELPVDTRDYTSY